MAVLLVVAVPLTIHSFRSFGNPSVPAAPSEPQSTDTNTSRPVQKKRSGIPQVRQQTLDPTLRTDILMASQKIEYSGGTRNIFRAVEPPPPPPPKPIAPVRPIRVPSFTNRRPSLRFLCSSTVSAIGRESRRRHF